MIGGSAISFEKQIMISRILRLALVSVSLLLMGCKADEMDISLDIADIALARVGTDGAVGFEAAFSNLGDLDEAQRAQFDQIEAVLSRYMTIDAFVIEPTDTGFGLQIAGEMPLSADPDTATPYFLLVSPSETLDGYSEVEVKTGAGFAAMRGEIMAINFMLAPDAFHPTRIRLTGDGARVIAPGAFVDGTPEPLFAGAVTGRLSMLFKGGVFDDTGALFLIRLP